MKKTGSGFRKQQYSERFSTGQVINENPPNSCSTITSKEHKIGDYAIFEAGDGFCVTKGELMIGSFKRGKVFDDKALFELDKGMLLEITPDGHRQIFSPEKASIHGYVCADGSIDYKRRRHGYSIKVTDPDSVLRNAFRQNIKKVYGIDAKEYVERIEMVAYGKEMVYDLLKYGPFGTYIWRTPTSYLDKEGASAWIRSYFDGDGTVHMGSYKLRDSRIGVSSVDRPGLEDVKIVLDEYFGIKSAVYPHRRIKPEYQKNINYDLVVRGLNDLKKFRDMIGFDSPTKRMKLDESIKRLEGG